MIECWPAKLHRAAEALVSGAVMGPSDQIKLSLFPPFAILRVGHNSLQSARSFLYPASAPPTAP